jgi:hypothetical protein
MKFSSRTMPLKAGARVNTPPLEANKRKSYADTPSACCGELHSSINPNCTIAQSIWQI